MLAFTNRDRPAHDNSSETESNFFLTLSSEKAMCLLGEGGRIRIQKKKNWNTRCSHSTVFQETGRLNYITLWLAQPCTLPWGGGSGGIVGMAGGTWCSPMRHTGFLRPDAALTTTKASGCTVLEDWWTYILWIVRGCKVRGGCRENQGVAHQKQQPSSFSLKCDDYRYGAQRVS